MAGYPDIHHYCLDVITLFIIRTDVGLLQWYLEIHHYCPDVIKLFMIRTMVYCSGTQKFTTTARMCPYCWWAPRQTCAMTRTQSLSSNWSLWNPSQRTRWICRCCCYYLIYYELIRRWILIKQNTQNFIHSNLPNGMDKVWCILSYQDSAPCNI